MIFLFLIMIVSFLEAGTLHQHRIEPPSVVDGNYMKIRILDSKRVDIDEIDGVKFAEISDIAYDKKRDILYALSDKARLFKLRIVIKHHKISALHAISGVKLRNIGDKKLLKPYRDSEGMALQTVDDKTRVLISFEQKPRVTQYDESLHALRSVPLPHMLRDIRHYQGKNKALESLTYDASVGIITAAEFPLRGERKGYHALYDSRGKLCTIKRIDPGNAITELEMMPDGKLLVLERKFVLTHFAFETTLVKVDIDDRKGGICKSEVLSWMSTQRGWNIDNFEGLTHYKDNLYIMISDDNNNRLEKTILTLFEIKD